jgi:hypothetical protein
MARWDRRGLRVLCELARKDALIAAGKLTAAKKKRGQWNGSHLCQREDFMRTKYLQSSQGKWWKDATCIAKGHCIPESHAANLRRKYCPSLPVYRRGDKPGAILFRSMCTCSNTKERQCLPPLYPPVIMIYPVYNKGD